MRQYYKLAVSPASLLMSMPTIRRHSVYHSVSAYMRRSVSEYHYRMTYYMMSNHLQPMLSDMMVNSNMFDLMPVSFDRNRRMYLRQWLYQHVHIGRYESVYLKYHNRSNNYPMQSNTIRHMYSVPYMTVSLMVWLKPYIVMLTMYYHPHLHM